MKIVPRFTFSGASRFSLTVSICFLMFSNAASLTVWLANGGLVGKGCVFAVFW